MNYTYLKIKVKMGTVRPLVKNMYQRNNFLILKDLQNAPPAKMLINVENWWKKKLTSSVI